MRKAGFLAARPLAARRFGGLVLLLVLLVGACAPRSPQPDSLTLRAVAYGDLPGWSEDRLAAALPAFQKSCARLTGVPDERAVGADGVGGRVGDWRPPCAAALALGDAPSEAAARRFFEHWFQPFRAANGDRADGLFTGYFEASLRAARRAGGPYKTPIYRRPDELVMVDLGLFNAEWRGRRLAGTVVEGQLRPYMSRAGIEAGGLAGRGLELLWADDPVDVFFLQIQGSGRALLADGTTVRLGYAGHNGQDYVSIGRLLVERGVMTLEEVSMQSLRAWMADDPKRAAKLMAENPAYIFFRELTGEGPLGAQGVVLTPGRSLAVDPAFMPYGAPVWLDAGGADAPLRRLLIAQDTGGAIRGPVRGDVFWGFGDDAAARAGTMRLTGRYYLLLPRSVAGRAPKNTPMDRGSR